MSIMPNDDRRNFIIQGAAFMGVAALGAPAALLGCGPKPALAEITATEDLMLEHGVLSRLLLIYEEMARRLRCCQDFPAPLLKDAASLLRRYIQEHHEKLEEEHVFPRFEQAGKMVALVKILRLQHEAGRQLLDHLTSQAAAAATKNFVQRAQLEAYLLLLTHLYRPHTAREDTLLFPALRTVMSPPEFADLGQKFAQLQATHLGPNHYDRIIQEIGDLEKALGIHDLEQFTPKF